MKIHLWNHKILKKKIVSLFPAKPFSTVKHKQRLEHQICILKWFLKNHATLVAELIDTKNFALPWDILKQKTFHNIKNKCTLGENKYEQS